MEPAGLSHRVKEYVRREYIVPARRRGDPVVRVVAGEVHKALRLSNRVPTVCDALSSARFLKESGVTLKERQGPPSGRSTTVVFTYTLQPEQPEPAPDSGLKSFLRLRGIAKDVFRSLGGGEAFIRSERDHFYAEDSPLRDPE